jgi:dipeptidyl aminopeptidase/acylaminoacyl peptidase
MTTRLRAVTVGLALALVLSSCLLQRPDDPGPLRYRDEVFSGVSTTSNVVYGQAVSQTGVPTTLRFDLYEPTGDTAALRPLVIWVHGGSFRSGSKTSGEIVDQASVLGRKGYVSASISYRLSERGCTVIDAACVESIVDATEDAQAAVRHLRANAATYRIDPNRIAIAGTSAGAITALNVGYGAEVAETSGTPGVSSKVSAAVSLSGARLLGSCEEGDAPALLFHGTADSLVPYQWAADTVDCAESGGVWAEMITWDGAGHVPYVANRDQILDLTTVFLFNSLLVRHIPA